MYASRADRAAVRRLARARYTSPSKPAHWPGRYPSPPKPAYWPGRYPNLMCIALSGPPSYLGATRAVVDRAGELVWVLPTCAPR
jgi:hypothetical protein